MDHNHKHKNTCDIKIINNISNLNNKCCDEKCETKEECHDYVVIGGGTAGITLTYLLTKKKKDVVCIEAGRDVDNDPLILNPQPLNSLEINYRNEYFSVGDAHYPNPSSHITSTNVHINHYDGGNVLGGSSSINDTIWWRSDAITFAKAGGLFADPLYIDNVFKALEHYTPNGTPLNPKRGTKGPIFVTQEPVTNAGNNFAQALQQVYQSNYNINIPMVTDYNSVNGAFVCPQVQFDINPNTLQRCSSSIGLLKGTFHQNIDLRLNAQGLQLIWDEKKNCINAVKYIKDNILHIIKVNKKVILCTGHNTPVILLQNGIGDQNKLSALGINVRVNNPDVGANLQNHISITGGITLTTADQGQIITNGLAYKNAVLGGAVPNPLNPTANGRDFQFFIIASPTTLNPNSSAILGLLLDEQSKGTVSLVDKNPLTAPTTNLNYLDSSTSDLQTMAQLVKVIQKTAIQLQNVGYTPSAALLALQTETDFENYVLANMSAVHHWHGQSLIGKVVDQNLNVIGVENLMVADVTLFPAADGNTQTMGYAAGCAAYTIITGDKKISF